MDFGKGLAREQPRERLEVYAAYPERFRVVTPVDPHNPKIDDVISQWIRLRDGVPTDPANSGLNRAFAAAAGYSLPPFGQRQGEADGHHTGTGLSMVVLLLNNSAKTNEPPT